MESLSGAPFVTAASPAETGPFPHAIRVRVSFFFFVFTLLHTSGNVPDGFGKADDVGGRGHRGTSPGFQGSLLARDRAYRTGCGGAKG